MKKKLSPPQSVKYLSTEIDKNLKYKHHVKDIAGKLNIVNFLLFKTKNFVNV